MASLEAFWRSEGHVPSVTDDPQLWAVERQRIESSPKAVVLLGASRIQLGFDMETFRRRYPELDIVQLAIDGSHPVASLRNLADDETFTGTVICSITIAGFRRAAWDRQQEHVDAYTRDKSLTNVFERRLMALLQENLVVLSSHLHPDRLITSFSRGRLPRPRYITTARDRSRKADYTMLNVARHRQRRIDKVRAQFAKHRSVPTDAWLADAREVLKLAKRIEARGGRVLFLRMPTEDEHWLLGDRMYPKSVYWDALAREAPASFLHFHDVPALRGFSLPDTSHLDRRDSGPFTRALLDELVRRGVLPAPASGDGNRAGGRLRRADLAR